MSDVKPQENIYQALNIESINHVNVGFSVNVNDEIIDYALAPKFNPTPETINFLERTRFKSIYSRVSDAHPLSQSEADARLRRARIDKCHQRIDLWSHRAICFIHALNTHLKAWTV